MSDEYDLIECRKCGKKVAQFSMRLSLCNECAGNKSTLQILLEEDLDNLEREIK